MRPSVSRMSSSHLAWNTASHHSSLLWLLHNGDARSSAERRRRWKSTCSVHAWEPGRGTGGTGMPFGAILQPPDGTRLSGGVGYRSL